MVSLSDTLMAPGVDYRVTHCHGMDIGGFQFHAASSSPRRDARVAVAHVYLTRIRTMTNSQCKTIANHPHKLHDGHINKTS